MVNLYKPYMPEDLPELNNILQSGALSYGKWGKLFESSLQKYLDNPLLLTLNSYNSAMLIAIAAMGLKPGDEVIASPMSCLASNQPFATQGIKIIWADIDPSRGTLDPASVRSKLSINTRAIIHNHFCGYPGYIDDINAIARENEIFVVDDAIEAFGTQYNDRPIGAKGGADITVFSFQSVRLPNTIDGGALSFNRPDLYERSLLLRDFGINRNNFRDNRGEINPDSDIQIPGYGATLNDLNSYIGCLQMDHIDSLLNKQRENAVNWMAQLNKSGLEINFLSNGSGQLPNYWVFGLLTTEKKEMMDSFRSKGYYASGVHLPNNYYSVFGEKQELPGVNDFYGKFLAIPCGWWLDLKHFNNE